MQIFWKIVILIIAIILISKFIAPSIMKVGGDFAGILLLVIWGGVLFWLLEPWTWSTGSGTWINRV